MGFVSVGHGFKRRRRHGFSHLLAVPGRSPCLSQTPFSASQSIHNSQSLSQFPAQPQSFASSLHAPAPVPAVAPQSLQDLPSEVLYRIYCFAGPGKHNELHLTCKHLNELFRGTDNLWFVERMVGANHLADLNEGVKRSWAKKLAKTAAKLPENYSDSALLQSLLHFPLKVARTRAAIDLAVFRFPFMDRRTVKFLKKRYGKAAIVADRASMCNQHKFKERYLEWRHMVLAEFCALVEAAEAETREPEPENLLLKAENHCVEFRDRHGLLAYKPLVHSVPIPSEMYHRMTSRKFHVILELSAQFDMGAANVPSLIEAVFASVSVSGKNVQKLFALLPPTTCSLENVLALLRTLARVSKSPDTENQAEEHLYKAATQALTQYYEAHPRDNNELIWAQLRELQMPGLVDHVVQLGGTMNLGIF